VRVEQTNCVLLCCVFYDCERTTTRTMVLSSSLTLLFFAVFLTDFLRIRGAAEAAATTLHGGKAEVNGCGTNQCYSPVYGLCFHSTSYECTSLLNNPRPRPQEMGLTRSPTPRPIVHMIKTENPILLQLNNVADNYILSASDRERILSKIEALLDETLDESWEVINVESPGEYIGIRRLQSSLRRGNQRRLNKTLYIPVIVTVRGREDMSDMARLFILQAMRNNLNLLLMYLKSLNANAFGSLQLSVEELNSADIGGPIVAPLPTLRPTNSPMQSTNTNTETKVETKTTSVEATSPGTPSWVWIIVAVACIAVGICLLWCICRADWCLCCGNCFQRKRDTKYETQKQLAIERWRHQPVQIRSNGDAHGNLVGVSRYDNTGGGRYEKGDI